MSEQERRAGYGSKSPHATLSDAAYEARVYQSKPRLEVKACPLRSYALLIRDSTEIPQFFLDSRLRDYYACILGGVEFQLNGRALQWWSSGDCLWYDRGKYWCNDSDGLFGRVGIDVSSHLGIHKISFP